MTWTGQTFTVGQILTAAQLNNLQADITAAFNGDSGGPRLNTAVIKDVASGNYQTGQEVTGSNSTLSYVKVAEFICPQGGTYNTKMVLTADAGTPSGRIYVDGFAVGTERSSAGTYYEDIVVTAGQKIQLYIKNSSLGNNTYGTIALGISAGTIVAAGKNFTV